MQSDDDVISRLRRAVLDDPRNGEKRYLLGAALADRRDYEGAVLEMSAAVALSPLLHVARLQLGLLHLTMAQPQHTIAVLTPLEELAEDSPLKHFKRGIEALIRDDFSNCVRSLEHGIELNQENESLNKDMLLIVQRVKPLLAQRPRDVAADGTAHDAEAVRTDFSLYGTTKH